MSKQEQSHPVALITGAARRVGAEIARCLHNNGFNIIVHYRNSKVEAEALKRELEERRPNSVYLIQADLNEPEHLSRFAQQIKQHFGRLDALINNASMFYATPVESADYQQWDDLMASNLKAPYFLSQSLAPLLAENKGSIVNISDIYSQRPKKQFSIYCMAKAANNMMTQALALELAPKVRVNAVAPGASLWPEDSQGAELVNEQSLDVIPLLTLGGAQPIAGAVKYLILDAPYTTGQILRVDGGKSLLQP